jgi:hypothetical protein
MGTTGILAKAEQSESLLSKTIFADCLCVFRIADFIFKKIIFGIVPTLQIEGFFLL